MFSSAQVPCQKLQRYFQSLLFLNLYHKNIKSPSMHHSLSFTKSMSLHKVLAVILVEFLTTKPSSPFEVCEFISKLQELLYGHLGVIIFSLSNCFGLYSLQRNISNALYSNPIPKPHRMLSTSACLKCQLPELLDSFFNQILCL